MSQKNTKTKDRLINELSAIMEAFSSVSGRNMEIVLHDLEHSEAPVIRIVNGHVSGRQIGSSLLEAPEDNKGLMSILAHEVPDGETGPTIFNHYRTVGPLGRSLHSSAVIFRGMNGKAMLSLCFNADYSDVEATRKALTRLLPEDNIPTESETGLESKMNEIIRACIPPSGQLRTGATKKEKVEIVRQMQEKGLFIVRGGVEMTARVLGVSRYTIYNYLDEIKKNSHP